MPTAQNGSPEPGAAYTSPAHRVLLNGDLLVIIFETFNPKYIEENAATYARASRVCRAWDRPASVCLWRSIPSLFPLFNVLHPVPRRSSVSRGLWRYNYTSSSAANKDYFTEIIVQKLFSDPFVWGRFLLCASRVQEIIEWSLTVMEPDLLRCLLERNNSTTFLPNLRGITWRDPIVAPRGLLSALVPVSLRRLCYSESVPGKNFQDVMTALDTPTNPPLSCLVVNNPNGLLFTSSCPPLSRFRELRYIRIGQSILDPTNLKRLYPLPRLEHIILGRVTDFEGCQSDFNYPSLRHLEISSTGTSIAEFFAHVCAPALEYVELWMEETATEYDPRAISAATRRIATVSRRLRHFYLTAILTRGVDIGDTVDFRRIIEPLFSLPEVRTLSVRYGWNTALDDGLVRALAEAWPALERLSLNLVLGEGVCPSDAALARLARACPRLQSIALPLELSRPLDVPEAAPPPGHPLDSLHLGVKKWDAAAVSEKELARMVDVLFPNLEPAQCFIRWSSLDAVPVCVSLKGVRDELEALRKQRREGIESDSEEMTGR